MAYYASAFRLAERPIIRRAFAHRETILEVGTRSRHLLARLDGLRGYSYCGLDLPATGATLVGGTWQVRRCWRCALIVLHEAALEENEERQRSSGDRRGKTRARSVHRPALPTPTLSDSPASHRKAGA